jgi:hypothetical protein
LQSNELTRLTGIVSQIEIVFDKAEDFAAIVLDKIDVKSAPVGRGPSAN